MKIFMLQMLLIKKHSSFFSWKVVFLLTLSERVFHIRYSGRMHTPSIGVTSKFSLMYFKNPIYTIFVLVRLIRYECKRTYYKQKYYCADYLLMKIVIRNVSLLKITNFKSNASRRSLLWKKLKYPVSKEFKWKYELFNSKNK